LVYNKTPGNTSIPKSLTDSWKHTFTFYICVQPSNNDIPRVP
jgi:hypothetical protein